MNPERKQEVTFSQLGVRLSPFFVFSGFVYGHLYNSGLSKQDLANVAGAVALLVYLVWLLKQNFALVAEGLKYCSLFFLCAFVLGHLFSKP